MQFLFRATLAAWIVVFFGALLAAQELQIKGDTQVIERDRVVIVKDKILLVKKLPFQVEAPAGGLLYSWRFPVGVTAVERGNVLDVTAAPKGDLTISVQWAVIDWDAKKVDNKAASLAFAVGEVGPGPVPPDPKPPVDAFTQSLIDAYQIDATPDKQRIVAFFASLYRAAGTTDVNDQSLTKLGELYVRLVAARKRTYPDDGIILPIRKLIEAELNALITPTVDQPLDAQTRTKTAAAFNRIAAALEAVK